LKHKYLVEYNIIKVDYFNSVSAFIDQFKALKSKLDSLKLIIPKEAYIINFIVLLDKKYPV
jgi:hypothetical protein